jgi:hypothetical protein
MCCQNNEKLLARYRAKRKLIKAYKVVEIEGGVVLTGVWRHALSCEELGYVYARDQHGCRIDAPYPVGDCGMADAGCYAFRSWLHARLASLWGYRHMIRVWIEPDAVIAVGAGFAGVPIIVCCRYRIDPRDAYRVGVT